MAKAVPSHRELFLEHIPLKYLHSVLRALYDCYEAADEACDTVFERPEKVNIRPFYRRAMIEGSLREIARSFPEVTAEARRSPKSGWNHTIVTCGRAAFTQNSASHPDEVVRPSAFRLLYAGRDKQRYLFPDLEEKESPRDSIVYGILIHGQSTNSPIFPAFARIVFPKEDLNSYWPGDVDLFAQFPDVVREKTERLFADHPTVERVEEPVPELRDTSLRTEERA